MQGEIVFQNVAKFKRVGLTETNQHWSQRKKIMQMFSVQVTVSVRTSRRHPDEWRYISTNSLTSALHGVKEASSIPSCCTPGERAPVIHNGQEATWAPQTAWAFWKRQKFCAPVRNQTPYHLATTLVTNRTETTGRLL
jgi:hypothetical protein